MRFGRKSCTSHDEKGDNPEPHIQRTPNQQGSLKTRENKRPRSRGPGPALVAPTCSHLSATGVMWGPPSLPWLGLGRAMWHVGNTSACSQLLCATSQPRFYQQREPFIHTILPMVLYLGCLFFKRELTDRQSRLDTWDKCSGLVQWGDPDGWDGEGNGRGGSGWGTHVNPWLIHVNVWQKPLQYCKVISLQLIKINGKK